MRRSAASVSRDCMARERLGQRLIAFRRCRARDFCRLFPSRDTQRSRGLATCEPLHPHGIYGAMHRIHAGRPSGDPYGAGIATHIIIAWLRFRRGYRFGSPLRAGGATRSVVVSLSLSQRYAASESEAMWSIPLSA